MNSNKIVSETTKVSRRSPQNGSDTVEIETENIELDRKILKERYISPEKDSELLINWDKYNNIMIKHQRQYTKSTI